jgi:hypothetical protein
VYSAALDAPGRANPKDEETDLTRRTYTKPQLTKLGLLRNLTRFSIPPLVDY